jgi:hypothetical protein
VEQKEFSRIAEENAKLYNMERQFGGFFLTKQNILLGYDLAIMITGIYPNELKTVTTKAYRQTLQQFYCNCQTRSNQDVFQ